MGYINIYSKGGLAQSVERWNHNPQVEGSSPPAATIFALQKWWMKPEKASLHAPKVRFMARSAASYFCVLDTPEACKTQSAS